jgi:hypothetical protein
VGERVDSDHLPLEITIEGTNQEEKGKGGAKEGDNISPNGTHSPPAKRTPSRHIGHCNNQKHNHKPQHRSHCRTQFRALG